MKQENKKKRRMKGTIISTKMKNTVVVKVERTHVHPRYGKRFTTSKKYLSAVGRFQLNDGDSVVIEETRPLSKTKRFRIVEKVT